MISRENLILSDGIELRPYVGQDGEVKGFSFRHKIPESEYDVEPGICSGRVNIVSDTRPCWQVVQEEPLTLSPSIRCVNHGTHGFVTDGKWVPA